MQRKEHMLGDNKIFVEQLTPDKKTFEYPLVFVHGSFGGFFMWETITKYLAERGFECFSLSLRGHKPSGDIDLSKVGMKDYVDDISVVVNELGLKTPVVVGHSMAGLLVLMYGKESSGTKAIISIDPSQSLELQGVGDESAIEKIPLVYSAMDAGMPTDPMEIVKALPDIPQEMLMKMKDMLVSESGKARRDRKKGISIPKESLNMPILMIGAELGKSVPFGISLESTKKMSEYYSAELFEVKGATHPGIIMGTHATEVAEKIANWLGSL
jgi:pimeloyl-ACP methyl ester carboxylesterase